MPLEPSPYTKRIVEVAGCPNVASPEEAERIMRAGLEEAERFLRRCLTVFGKSPMGIVSKACQDLLTLMVVTQMRAALKVGEAGGGAMDVTALTRILALVATSATAALTDMSFLNKAGISGRCAGCGLKEDCDIEGHEKG